MDIHRCRFVPYPVSPINALAFSHASVAGAAPPRSLRLAVGRASGDIEIWNPRGGLWVQEQILRGGSERSVEGLTWTQNADGKLRLFSIGYSNAVTEWDLAAGRPLRHVGANHGDIWCISAQPRQQQRTSSNVDIEDDDDDGADVSDSRNGFAQKLVVGCADGALVVLSTADDELTYSHTLPPPTTRRARVLSIAWRGDHTIIAGYSDSCIRLFDMRGRGRALHTLSLGAAPRRQRHHLQSQQQNKQKKSAEVLVWSVRCLADGTIVSGDSTGEVKIWDAATLALVQRLAGHRADVLDVAVSLDGSVLVSSGIDRRSVVYRRTTTGVSTLGALDASTSSSRWAEASHQRLHASDVKSLAAFEAEGFAVVVSGGLDATPIVMPLHRHGLENARRLAATPNVQPLISSPGHRLIASWWAQELRIWAVGSSDEVELGANGRGDTGHAHDLVAKIVLQGEESITSCALASDASLIVASTSARTILFRLQAKPATRMLKVRKIDAPAALSKTGSSLVSLSPDCKWLFRARNGSEAEMFRVHWEDDSPDGVRVESQGIALGRRFSKHATSATRKTADDQTHDRSIRRVAWSHDSTVVVGCDAAGRFDKWVRQTEANEGGVVSPASSDSESSDDEASSGKARAPWARSGPELPQLNAAPLVLSFAPDAVGREQAEAGGSSTGNDGDMDMQPTQRKLAMVVVTDDHQLLEFDAVSGRRSEWSRRNPPECLPSNFTSILERAMGCVWDVSDRHRRIWLHGSSWLWMFDLSKDLPSARTGLREMVGYGGNKRKHDETEDEDGWRPVGKTSGAGGRIPTRLQGTGVGAHMITTDGEQVVSTRLDQPAKMAGLDSGDEMDVDAASPALLQLRRGSQGGQAAENGGEADDGQAEAWDGGDGEGLGQHAPSSWGTFKYRPILGVVALSGQARLAADADEPSQGGSDDVGVELAVVERPLWEADLPQAWKADDEVER